jgi:flavin-dependent dehydrogenase
MAEVTVVGAGLAGLVAAINCARAGHAVRVLDKFERVGGNPYARPAVEVTPMDTEALGRFIGVELIPPYISPCEEIVFRIYGKRYELPARQLHFQSVERGSRSTSLDSYLYEVALGEGVEFQFATPCDSRDDFSRLPPNSIIATGLVCEPFLALSRPCLEVSGFIGKASMDGPPRLFGFFDRYTRYYNYCAVFNGIAFGLAFDAGRVDGSLRDTWERQLREWEGIEFERLLPYNGVVATGTINSPCLFAGDKILAGTLAGMQDPFFLFGLHGSLVSGKIAALAIEDREQARLLFDRFNSAYRYVWLVKRLFDVQPHWARNLFLRTCFGAYLGYKPVAHPVIERVMRIVPGFGKI